MRNVIVTGDRVNIEVSVGNNGGDDDVDAERDEGNKDKVNEDEEIEATAHRLKLPDVGDTGSKVRPT